ncbi:hypothetical protein X975_15124, partial [Stegodyphus mimosarum]
MNTMKSFAVITILLATSLVVSASQQDQTKTDVIGRHNDLARVNLGTAISLIVPVALGVALIAFLAPVFQGLFAAPIPFGPTLGYARNGKSLFSGITQENIMQVLDTVTKAIETFAKVDANEARPKSQ